MKTYFEHINDGIRTTLGGLKLTFRHLWQARNRRSNHNIGTSGYFNEQEGMVTLQYPLEVMPIPDNGRYRLHNEMDDCIVCDKCAKVCPVDCIDIEPIKATGEVGKASDGSPIRLYAAKFDIDMAKCCYCGLCTTVCPTECLTMTKTFDYSEFDVRDMNYHYSNLSPEEAEAKKALYEQFMREKEELKKQKATPASTADSPETTEEKPVVRPKPAFAPKKPISSLQSTGDNPPATEGKSNSQPTIDSPETTEEKPVVRPKPAFAPKKPISSLQSTGDNPQATEGESNSQPTIDSPQKIEEKSTAPTPIGETGARPKPVFMPKKPAVQPSADSGEQSVSNPASTVDSPQTTQEKSTAPTPIGGTGARPKPVFVPKKPKQE